MLLLTTTRDALLAPLQSVSGIVEKRHTLPILSNVLLEKQGEALKKKAEALKNPKASEEKKLDFIRSKQDLDQKTRNFLRKVEQEEVKLRQDMVTLVFSATYEVARAKGFNFVVDVTAGGVLYADQTMDLTQDVLAEVNKIYKEKGNDKGGKK